MTDMLTLDAILEDGKQYMYCSSNDMVYLVCKEGDKKQYIPLVSLEGQADTEDVLTHIFLNYELRECSCQPQVHCFIK